MYTPDCLKNAFFTAISYVTPYCWNNNSIQLTHVEFDKIVQETGFPKYKIHQLYNRFNALDTNGDGYVTRGDFYRVPDFAKNPLRSRIIATFFDGTKKDEGIDFNKFVKVLAVFQAKVDPEVKLRLIFSMFDHEKSNHITEKKLKKIIQLMSGPNTTSCQITRITEGLMGEADIDKDGKISFEEFYEAMHRVDVAAKMNI